MELNHRSLGFNQVLYQLSYQSKKVTLPTTLLDVRLIRPVDPITSWLGASGQEHRQSGTPEKLVEREGVEPPKPVGRLVYSQGISPVKASPELVIGLEPMSPEYKTGDLPLIYTSNIVGAGARAQPGLSATAFPDERLCPNVYTIRIVKERSVGA